MDACVAVHAYEGVVAREVLAMKGGGVHATTRSMAAAMWHRARPMIESDAVVTWAPTAKKRRRTRGYDQAEELARAFGREAGLAVHDLAKRVSPHAQHGAGRSDRARVGFDARPVFPLGNWPQIVVVDDVRTTGATFGAIARAIRDVGAEKIIGISYAATPARR